MPNLSPKKVTMPTLDAIERSHNFLEVNQGYTIEDALTEADRCLQCKHKPCVNNCPVNVNIPEFIRLIKESKFLEAYKIITETNHFPAICGRVCPQESQCEKVCVRAIQTEAVGIGRLERFVADYYNDHYELENHIEPKNKHKVAIIGSGPAGLSCAMDLVKEGYEVTIFESLHKAGGVLSYGIPEFRLPKSIVNTQIEHLKNLGVNIICNTVIGRTLTIEDLQAEGFEAFFIASGAGVPNFMGIPNEGAIGVCSANEYLTRVNLMKANVPAYHTPLLNSKKIAVIGGGNVAMDAARCAKRLGNDVTIVYRRSIEEMPARLEEVHHAKEEGIKFSTLTNPTKIMVDDTGRVSSLILEKMELSDVDERGRRSVKPISNSEYTEEYDTIIMAIGTSPNPILARAIPELELNSRGGIVVNEVGQSNIPYIFAGGDAVSGAATVILAMGAGKTAAKGIHNYLQTK